MKHEGSWRLERQIGIEKGEQKGAERQRSGPLVYKMPVFFLVFFIFKYHFHSTRRGGYKQ
jgi:hypothetical protein